MVRRAVGFEFETNWLVSHADGSPFKKYDPIYTGANWRMEADEPANGQSDVEFVVKPPFPENPGGLASLRAVMPNMQTFFGNLTGAAGGKGHILQDGGANPYVDAGLHDDVVFQAGDPAGTPQTTVGVRLERLVLLLTELARGGGDAKGELLGLAGRSDPNATVLDKISDVVTDVPTPTALPLHDRNRAGTGYRPSDSMRGLMAMLVQYLRRGAVITGVDPYAQAFKYAKMVTIIMGRTDFGGMFRQLPNSERDYYVAHPTHWVRFVLDTAKASMPTADFDENGDVIARGLKGEGRKVERIPIKRKDWLMGMLLGHDLLNAQTFERFNPGTRANFSGAFGALGTKTDDVGALQAHKGVILELREVKDSMNYLDWAQFAEDVFNYITMLNAYAPGGGGAVAPQYTKTATPARGVRG